MQEGQQGQSSDYGTGTYAYDPNTLVWPEKCIISEKNRKTHFPRQVIHHFLRSRDSAFVELGPERSFKKPRNLIPNRQLFKNEA